MKKEEKIEEPELCSVEEAGSALKPNPAAVLKYTVKNMRLGMRSDEAKAKAEKDAIAAKKFAGMSKLKWEKECLIRTEIERDLAADKAKLEE